MQIIGDIDKNVRGLMTTIFLNTKISEVEGKYQILVI